jgi:hypothetical protein
MDKKIVDKRVKSLCIHKPRIFWKLLTFLFTQQFPGFRHTRTATLIRYVIRI